MPEIPPSTPLRARKLAKKLNKQIVTSRSAQSANVPVAAILREYERLSAAVRELSLKSGVSAFVAARSLLRQTNINTKLFHSHANHGGGTVLSHIQWSILTAGGGPVMVALEEYLSDQTKRQMNFSEVLKLLIPGHRTFAHSKNDEFSDVAADILFVLKEEGKDLDAVNSVNWPLLMKHIRQNILPRIVDHGTYEELTHLIKAKSDQKSKSRMKQRVWERILERTAAMLGVARP